MSVIIFVLSTGVGRIGSGPLTKYAFVSQNRVCLYRGGGVGNPFQHSLMHAHIHSKPYGPWPLIWHPGRHRGGPSYPPTWHNYGLFIGPAPVLRPVRRRFKLAILTVLSIHNPHKDEMQSWDSLSLLTLLAIYLIQR